MNAQRWLALGFALLVVGCIATRNLWTARIFGGGEEEAPPTPEIEAEASAEETAVAVELQIPSTPTLDPIVAEIMVDLQMGPMGIGIEPFIIQAGSFVTIDPMHQGQGTASIYQFSDTQRVLRLDRFSVSSGPDLRVLLSEHEAPRTSAEALLPSYLDLGPLKSPSGAQNYAIPEGQDMGRYRSVVIYSMSLNIVYTTATLEDVRGSG